jgi:hypothetical protein
MTDPRTPEDLNMACFELSREIETTAFSVPQAAPLARTLLRVVGRVLIDTGGEDADPATWPNTEEMVVQWVEEAMRPLGYRVVEVEEPGVRAGGNPDT